MRGIFGATFSSHSKKEHRFGRCFIMLLMNIQFVRLTKVDIRYFATNSRNDREDNLKTENVLNNMKNLKICDCGICCIKMKKYVAASTKR